MSSSLGIGGNLAAIQASRLSTRYNLFGCTDFSEYKTSLFLLLLTIPGHALFLGTKHWIDAVDMGAPFYLAFFSSAVIQVHVILNR